MRSRPIEHRSGSIAGLWLTIQAHADAFRYDPVAYLTALKWRILGKRVRARGQMAPLLSQSRKVYDLWLMQQAQRGGQSDSALTLPPIIALVDISGDEDKTQALQDTVASLTAEGIMVLPIGAEQPIMAATAAIDWEAEPWLMPVMAGDQVSPGTALAYRAALAGLADPATRLCYADDDQIGGRAKRRAPHFKPDWNDELFQHFDYLTGACIVKVGRADMEAVAERSDWARSLIVTATGKGRPVHVRQMLHHRVARMVPQTMPAAVERPQALPAVTIIVPTRNRVDLLRTCLDGVAASDYPNVEVIVVDNDSDDPETLAYLAALDTVHATVLRHTGPFNYSAINNRAVAQARGELLCLLNNDIEVIEPDWLVTMAVQAVRHDVGAVGARLLYPDGRIQHAGVVIGVGNAAGHAHRFVHPDEQGYFRRHMLPQFVSAVTGACLVVQRERFLAVGGLDERNFAVAFNDVDLCLRLNQKGWQSFYEPRATLIHHESVSRGLDRDPIGAARFASELAALQRIWKTNEVYDPYHHPELSRAAERFALAI